jgi:hypothetical protein
LIRRVDSSRYVVFKHCETNSELSKRADLHFFDFLR